MQEKSMTGGNLKGSLQPISSFLHVHAKPSSHSIM